MPFQPEQPNICIWLCRGKGALFTHILFVETGCTSKLLQGEMCRLLIDKMTRLIMKNVSVVAVAFNIPVSCILYSCRNVLEVHRYFHVHVEQTLHLFCKFFLSRHCHMASLMIGAFFKNDAIQHLC